MYFMIVTEVGPSGNVKKIVQFAYSRSKVVPRILMVQLFKMHKKTPFQFL